MKGLTNYDASDLEVLHIIDDCTNGLGWAPLEDIMLQLNLSTKYPARNIASRFRYMCECKWIQRHKHEPMYRITGIGKDLMNGNLSGRVRQSLEKLDHGQRVLVMEQMGLAYRGVRDPYKRAMRRQWQHNTGRRKG